MPIRAQKWCRKILRQEPKRNLAPNEKLTAQFSGQRGVVGSEERPGGRKFICVYFFREAHIRPKQKKYGWIWEGRMGGWADERTGMDIDGWAEWMDGRNNSIGGKGMALWG